ncbi:MAG: ECF transporter S component [Firmicutes bacterium]|nr:ECF transporter S component [Bacillota bacterium]
MLGKLVKKFSLFDLVLLALMACLGIATKPIIVPLTQIITGPLFIPGGVIAGGFYMLWIVLGVALVQKTGAGTLIAVVQAIMVTATGIMGTHGFFNIFTYILPGLAVDLVMLISRHRGCCLGCCFAGGIAANISGTALVNLVFFRLPLIPLLLSLSAAALSGGLGGIIAHSLNKQLKKSGLSSILGKGDKHA